jgi:flagellar basal body rod protein FlgG
MNDSLYIAATGLHTQQKGVDTISNNLANVNTAGFKKGRVSFEDLVYRDMAGADRFLSMAEIMRQKEKMSVSAAPHSSQRSAAGPSSPRVTAPDVGLANHAVVVRAVRS